MLGLTMVSLLFGQTDGSPVGKVFQQSTVYSEGNKW